MIDTLIEELKGEIDRSTLQVIAVPDPAARYLLPLDILTEVIKYLLGEFLIGLLGFEAMSLVGQRLHAAGQMARDWVSSRRRLPSRPCWTRRWKRLTRRPAPTPTPRRNCEPPRRGWRRC